jgi:hypothetical protein
MCLCCSLCSCNLKRRFGTRAGKTCVDSALPSIRGLLSRRVISVDVDLHTTDATCGMRIRAGRSASSARRAALRRQRPQIGVAFRPKRHEFCTLTTSRSADSPRMPWLWPRASDGVRRKANRSRWSACFGAIGARVRPRRNREHCPKWLPHQGAHSVHRIEVWPSSDRRRRPTFKGARAFPSREAQFS